MIDKSDDIKSLAVALLKAQKAIRPAVKDSDNPHLRSKYAGLSSVWDACRGPLTENGLTVVQTAEPAELGMVLRTTLLHESGQFLSGITPLAYDPTKMQSLGSAITYARRYGLAAMVGVVADEDDDGHQAHDPRPAQQPQRQANGRERDQWGSAHRGPTQERREANGQGGRKDYGPPKTGRHLWAYCCRVKEETGQDLAAYLKEWARLQGVRGKLVEWDEATVADAYAECLRKVESHGDAYEEAVAN